MSALLAILLSLRMLGIPAQLTSMDVSGYWNGSGAPPYQGLTASGVQAGPQTAACGHDLPFGTHLYIDGVGWRVCQDRGPAIKAGMVDVWQPTEAEAWALERHQLAAIVVKP